MNAAPRKLPPLSTSRQFRRLPDPLSQKREHPAFSTRHPAFSTPHTRLSILHSLHRTPGS